MIEFVDFAARSHLVAGAMPPLPPSFRAVSQGPKAFIVPDCFDGINLVFFFSPDEPAGRPAGLALIERHRYLFINELVAHAFTARPRA